MPHCLRLSNAYRDGCKLSQPLNAISDDEEEAVAKADVEAVAEQMTERVKCITHSQASSAIAAAFPDKISGPAPSPHVG